MLRRGAEVRGLREPLQLSQFKPALPTNPAKQTRYASNRLLVARQVAHSPNHSGDQLDMVLFLNRVPAATAELKGKFTQSVEDAVDQYRVDRWVASPAPTGKAASGQQRDEDDDRDRNTEEQ